MKISVKDQISLLEKKIKELRNKCVHQVVVKRGSDMYLEYWENPSGNIFEYHFRCKECGKKWSKTLTLEQYKTYLNKLKRKHNV